MSSPKYQTALSKPEQDSLRKDFTRSLAIHLRSVREDKKLSQEELALKAGINTAYYGHLERGIYSPTMFVIWRIAKAMDMTLEEFMTGFKK